MIRNDFNVGFHEIENHPKIMKAFEEGVKSYFNGLTWDQLVKDIAPGMMITCGMTFKMEYDTLKRVFDNLSNQQKKCVCPIENFSFNGIGCKCGQMERERNGL